MANPEENSGALGAANSQDCDRLSEAPMPAARSEIDNTLRQILCDVLGLKLTDVAKFDNETGLFGHIPELDSMAVAGLLTELEDRFDFIIDDEDVDGEMLETYGGLLAFAEGKVVTA